MKTTFLFTLCLCSILIFLLVQPSHAAIYKYLDKDGQICFANDLQSIPEQFRAAAKIVSGEADQESRTPTQNKQAEIQPGNAESVTLEKPAGQQQKPGLFNNRLLLSTVVVVSAVFVFAILGVLETDYKKAVVIARISLLWAVVVYLLFMHAGEAIRLVRTTGGAIEEVKRQSEEKGKKAAKAMKALNEMVQETGSAPSPEPAESEGNK